MRFGLILTTRGNPRRAAAVIESARFMASGKHEVTFAVALDEDDTASVEFFKTYDPPLVVSIAPRPPGIPECYNRCVPLMDCDTYMVIADDGFFATVDWDEACAKFIDGAFPRRELVAFAWTDTANPAQPTILMASREWIELTGDFIDPRFPFWFSDTAFGEVWSFVVGRAIPVVPTLIMLSKPGRHNPRLRDLDFWWDFYAHTRKERLALAAKIRAALGITLNEVVLQRVVAQWEKRDAEGRRNSASIEDDKRPPDAEYMVAHGRAMAAMGRKQPFCAEYDHSCPTPAACCNKGECLLIEAAA